MRFRSLRLVAIAAAAGLACDSTLIGTGQTANAYVTTQSTSFAPTQVTIQVGQTVLWAFGSGSHNVLFNEIPGAPADCPDVVSAGTCTRQFLTAGSFGFFCGPHVNAGMVGTVVVNP